ncbi:MAG: FAD-dependent oxidoreductase [Pseudomonadota bacterium]
MDKPDLLVIGGGIFGLWVAREGLRAGMSVVLADKAEPGQGASATPLGVLMPHMPAGWSAMKAFQLAALMSLAQEAEALAAETGASPFYRRPGRLTPLRKAEARVRAEAQITEAAHLWGAAGRLEVLDELPEAAACLASERAPFGWVHETLTAHVDARAYLTCLRASVAVGADLRLGWRAEGPGGAPGEILFNRGSLTARHVVIAAGWQSRNIAPFQAERGVKGQAARLSAQLPEGMPVIHAPGLFIVRQGAGEVAVGSTSERVWQDPDPDAALEPVIAAARELCPPLVPATVTSRWSGIRPKGPRPEPVVGPLPGQKEIWIASGGYKIGLGIAHHVAKALIGAIAGDPQAPPLPPEFAPLPLEGPG